MRGCLQADLADKPTDRQVMRGCLQADLAGKPTDRTDRL